MKSLILAFLLCVGLALSTPLQAEGSSITIGDSPGGMLDDWAFFERTLELSKVPVRFEGTCVSACTFLLGIPKSQFCVEPTAVFGFHMPYDPATGKPIPDPILDQINHRYYPKPLQEYFKAHPLTREVKFLYADDLVKMGVANACPDRAAE